MIISTSIIINLITGYIVNTFKSELETKIKESLEPVKDQLLECMGENQHIYAVDPEFISLIIQSMTERKIKDFTIDSDEGKLIVAINDPNIGFFEMDLGIKGIPFQKIEKTLFE